MAASDAKLQRHGLVQLLAHQSPPGRRLRTVRVWTVREDWNRNVLRG